AAAARTVGPAPEPHRGRGSRHGRHGPGSRVGKAGRPGRGRDDAARGHHAARPPAIRVERVDPSAAPLAASGASAAPVAPPGVHDAIVRFYAALAPQYHLIYGDWRTAIRRQARVLDTLIRRVGGDPPLALLDCTCGIGTQAIGLALLGYRVHGTDLS